MKVLLLLATIAACTVFLHWNEHSSPWGRDVQAAKLEMLKAQICNEPAPFSQETK
jgi:hypothetical protein